MERCYVPPSAACRYANTHTHTLRAVWFATGIGHVFDYPHQLTCARHYTLYADPKQHGTSHLFDSL
jgi:hypothetical protein